jgi:ATP-dependent exoDNAse (exonuclease V) beta subunit
MQYTESQQLAIETIDDNLQIIACAGSGKTQAISPGRLALFPFQHETLRVK